MLNSLSGITGVPGVKTDTRHTRLYNNQFFDYLSEQMPRNHKEMFKWCEVVYANTPVVVNGIKKLINYPLTDFQYKTDSKDKRQATKEFLSNIDIMSHLVSLGVDYYIYGNVFRSIYFPFTRFLRCKVCGTETNLEQAKYCMKKGDFVLTCGNCNTTRIAEIEDKDSQDINSLKLVSWDPKQIELSQNPITGKTKNFYKMSASIRKGITVGNPNIVQDIPQVFLDAYKKGRNIEMSSNFRHIKATTLSGFSSGWGISPLVPTLKLYMYTAILRKSVEAIGLEHITPQRILYPEARGNDPTMMSSMGQWKSEITKALRTWRMDPNYVMTSPYPTGVVNIGSQGRAVMPTNEIKAAEEDMLRALDVPVEFVYTATSTQNSPISLRILENQLKPYVSQLVDYVNWIIDTVNAKYDKDLCPVDFTPFTLSDDVMKTQMLVQSMGHLASRTTVQEALDLDPDIESDKMIQDTLKDMKDRKRLEKEQQRIEDDLAHQTLQEQQASNDGRVPQYDQKKLIAQAQNMVAQLLTVPYGDRRSYLAQLKGEDYVMYSLVSSLLDSARDRQDSRTSAKGGIEGTGLSPNDTPSSSGSPMQ